MYCCSYHELLGSTRVSNRPWAEFQQPHVTWWCFHIKDLLVLRLHMASRGCGGSHSRAPALSQYLAKRTELFTWLSSKPSTRLSSLLPSLPNPLTLLPFTHPLFVVFPQCEIHTDATFRSPFSVPLFVSRHWVKIGLHKQVEGERPGSRPSSHCPGRQPKNPGS